MLLGKGANIWTQSVCIHTHVIDQITIPLPAPLKYSDIISVRM